MVAKDRRGKRSWVPALLATFWILLAVASSAYLFRLATDPSARRVETAMAGQPAVNAPGAQPADVSASGGLTASEAKALAQSNAAKDREIAALKAKLEGLNSQVTALSQRLKPLEKVLGPVASLPGSASVTTSDPSEIEVGSPGPSVEERAPSPSLKAKMDKPLPPGTSVPQTKPTDLSGLTAKPVEPPTPPVKAAEPPAPPAKPVAEAEPPETPASPVKPAKPSAKPVQAAASPEEPAPPSDPSEAAEQRQTALAEPVSPPAKPKVAEPIKPVPEPAKPAAEVAAKPVPPEPKPTEAAKSVPPEPKPAETAKPPVQLSSNEPANAPIPPDSDASLAASPPAIPPGTTRFGIELGTVEKQDGVRPMWRDLLTNHAALVAGLQARRIIAPDKKWRLIAGPFSSAAEAMQACTLFKKADMPCEATVFAGDAL